MAVDMLVFTFDSIEYETDRAWLMFIEGEKMWLPKSQCVVEFADRIIEIPGWLAREKGLA